MSTMISDNVALRTNLGGGERLKKVIGISLVTLLASAVMASATATNWTMTMKAADSAGKNFNTSLTVGTFTGYTDNADTTKGEPGNIGNPGGGSTLATVATKITGATKEGILDNKAPITLGTESKVWEVHVYTLDNSGPGISSITLTITPGTGTSAPVYKFNNVDYSYTFEGAGVTGGKVVYNAATPMPTSFQFTFDSPKTSFATADVFTMTLAPSAVVDTPEPGSMLALGSGLVGLVGFGIRRRK